MEALYVLDVLVSFPSEAFTFLEIDFYNKKQNVKKQEIVGEVFCGSKCI